MMRTAKLACLFVVLLLPLAVAAKTLRWAAQGDILTMDPRAQNNLPPINVFGQVYEPLFRRDKAMNLIALLATRGAPAGQQARTRLDAR